jgi:predicted HAD superfamily hydrolase
VNTTKAAVIITTVFILNRGWSLKRISNLYFSKAHCKADYLLNSVIFTFGLLKAFRVFAAISKGTISAAFFI